MNDKFYKLTELKKLLIDGNNIEGVAPSLESVVKRGSRVDLRFNPIGYLP